ncbi:hypothetical protein AAC387_Pa07g1248 [Persea americana]
MQAEIDREEEINDLQLRIVTETEMDPSVSPEILSSNVGNCIEHRVSMMDTLAGVAIKYGVEVSDIKRLNGLTTDLQMFAHNSLQIPLPGRHPPSSVNQGGGSPDVLSSFQLPKMSSAQWGVSPAMSSLQGYYGLAPSSDVGAAEGTKMVVNTRGMAQYLEDVPQHKTSIYADPTLSPHRRSRSYASGFPLCTSGFADEKSEHRHSQTDGDQAFHTPVLLLKDDTSNSCGFSGLTGNSLALRPKSSSRTSPLRDTDLDRVNSIPIGVTFFFERFSGFRKSSSTSDLGDTENSSTVWPTSKLAKRSDLQATSTGSSTRTIFDGLPKPVTIRRNKAAMD